MLSDDELHSIQEVLGRTYDTDIPWGALIHVSKLSGTIN
jgi:hypothetical protein